MEDLENHAYEPLTSHGMILQVFQDAYMIVKSMEYVMAWNAPEIPVHYWFVNCKLLSGSPRFFCRKRWTTGPPNHLKKNRVSSSSFVGIISPPSFRANNHHKKCLGNKTAISWMDFWGPPKTNFVKWHLSGTLNKHRFPVLFGDRLFCVARFIRGF